MPKTNRKTGRPTKFTPETCAEILRWLQAGSSLETAAEAAGVTSRTLQRWLARAEDLEHTRRPTQEETDFCHFLQAVRTVRAKQSVQVTSDILEKTEKDWRAGAWWLERSFPNEWGRRRVEITGKDSGRIRTTGGAIVLNLDADDVDPNELDRQVGQLLRPDGGT